MFYIFSCTSNIFHIQYYFVVSYVIKKEMSSVTRFILLYMWILLGSKQQKHKISLGTKLVTAYSAYFGMPIGDQDKTWSPRVCCRSRRSTLEGWLQGEICVLEIKCMPFAILRIWREPTNHLNDCYFCMVDVSHYRKSKDERSIVYPSIPSSIAPVPHCEDLPIPEPPTLELPSCVSTSSEEDTDADFCGLVQAKSRTSLISKKWMTWSEIWDWPRKMHNFWPHDSKSGIC